jgi:hypothetical protein
MTPPSRVPVNPNGDRLMSIVLQDGGYRIVTQTVRRGQMELDVTVKLCRYGPPIQMPDGTTMPLPLKRTDPVSGEKVPDPVLQVIVESNDGAQFKIRKNHGGYRVRFPGFQSMPVKRSGTGKRRKTYIEWWNKTAVAQPGATYPEEHHPSMGDRQALRYLTQRFGKTIAERILCEILDAEGGNPRADVA